MSLNCKQGDLAFIVSARNPENVGKIVTVVKPVGNLTKGQEFMFNGTPFVAGDSGFHWWVEASGSLTVNYYDLFGVHVRSAQVKTCIATDASLRPIRDSDEPDETLMWAPTPGVTVE